MDLETIVGAATKSTLGAFTVAILYGVSMIIQAVRGGNLSEKQRVDVEKRLEDVEARLKEAEERIDALTRTAQAMRYQRDQARLRVEFLEMTHGVDRTVWPADPEE